MELCTVFFKGFNQFFFENKNKNNNNNNSHIYRTKVHYCADSCAPTSVIVIRWDYCGMIWLHTVIPSILLGKTITQVNLPARTHWDFRASFEIWAFTRFWLETQICFRYRNNCTRRRLCDHKVSSSKHRTAYCCWVGGPWRNCTTYIPLSILKNVLELMT